MSIIIHISNLSTGNGSKYASFTTSATKTYNVTVVSASKVNQLFYDGALLTSGYTATVTAPTNVRIVFDAGFNVDAGVPCEIVYQ